MTRSPLPWLLLAPAVGLAMPEVEDVSTLLERARIEGQASGILGGAAAERMRALGMPQPVEITARRLYRLADEECARVRAQFLQRGVVPPGETTPRDRSNWMEINWCPGGRPPSSIDPAPGETAVAGHDPRSQPAPQRQASATATPPAQADSMASVAQPRHTTSSKRGSAPPTSRATRRSSR